MKTKEAVRVIAKFMSYEPMKICGEDYEPYWVDRLKHISNDYEVLLDSMSFNKDGFLLERDFKYAESMDALLPVIKRLRVSEIKIFLNSPYPNDVVIAWPLDGEHQSSYTGINIQETYCKSVAQAILREKENGK